MSCVLTLSAKTITQKLEGKPPADKVWPDTLGDHMGQNQVLGEQTLLWSLLESHEIPSIIFSVPSGCGKVSGALVVLVVQGSLYPNVCPYLGLQMEVTRTYSP
ncbi:unnamed protein product [Caretta caretta]